MIVAKINNYELSSLEYEAELSKVMEKSKIDKPTSKSKKQALENLINGYLLLEKARADNIEISTDEIQSALLDLMMKSHSEKDFHKSIERQGLTIQDVRNSIRDNLATKKYITLHCAPKEDISIEKLREFYENNKENFVTKEMVKASHILIKDHGEEAYHKIIELRDKIKSTGNFSESAQYCSECPSRCVSGDLGFLTRGKMIKEFDEVAFNLDVNEISKPVKTKFGYHIILVTEKRKSQYVEFEKIESVLRERLTQIETELKLIDHLKDLKAKANIVIFRENI